MVNGQVFYICLNYTIPINTRHATHARLANVTVCKARASDLPQYMSEYHLHDCLTSSQSSN